MDERDDEHGVATQPIGYAPRVRGHFADVGVIELGHAPADARGVGQCGGAGEPSVETVQPAPMSLTPCWTLLST
jgi:hypothetical protein